MGFSKAYPNIVTIEPWSSVIFSDQVLVNTASTSLLPKNPYRKYICLSNNSNVMIYLQFENPAQLQHGFRLNAGGVITLSGADLFLGAINAISPTPTLIDVIEGV